MVEERLEGEEWLVLSTDGVHGTLPERQIQQLVLAGTNPSDIAASLITTALARGSRDNCTIMVARYRRD